MSSEIQRVLVLSDNDAQTLFWEMLLSENKFTMYSSRAGADGLELADKENIQLSIVQWELASMPGTVFVQKARASRKRRWMPFLIYSSRMSPEETAICKEIGIDNVLSMPLAKESARTMLAEIVERENNISQLERKLRRIEDFIVEAKPAEVLKLIGPDVSKKGPHLPRYKTLLAETFILLGQYEKAGKACKEALDADPKYLPAVYVRARCMTALGRHEEAISALDSVAKASPKNLQSMLNLGNAYVAADKIDKAKDVLAKYKDLDADACLAVNDVEGKIAIKEGKFDLAAQLLAETENGDEIARFYNSLGISMIATTQYDKGIETYQNAVKLLANKARIYLLYFNLGLAHRKKGDMDKSLELLCESYISEPSFEKAYNAIARAVGEYKTSGKSLPFEKLKAVKDARGDFLKRHPEVAKKIEERLAKKTQKVA